MAQKPQQKNQKSTQQRPAAPPPRQQQRPVAQPSREVATTGGHQVPAELMQQFEQHAGAGVSTDASDNVVPLIYLLQPLSPAVMRGHDKQIEGAEPGDIWLRNAPPEHSILKEGMVVQPCGFTKTWVEWMPNRGGFVQRHAERPADAQLSDIDDGKGGTRKAWLMPNDNVVVETREVRVIVHHDELGRLEYLMPLSGTGHTFHKTWNGAMRNEKLPNGARAPSFSLLYRLMPQLQQKNNNSWWQYTFEKVGFVEDVEDFQAGLTLYEAFESGEKRGGDYDTAGEASGEVADTDGSVDDDQI